MYTGEPISILDGVPIAVKDEIDCMPYPTTGKTLYTVFDMHWIVTDVDNQTKVVPPKNALDCD